MRKGVRGHAQAIEALIAGLQNCTKMVAAAMRNSCSLTDSSVELTRNAGDTLGNITHAVSNI